MRAAAVLTTPLPAQPRQALDRDLRPFGVLVTLIALTAALLLLTTGAALADFLSITGRFVLAMTALSAGVSMAVAYVRWREGFEPFPVGLTARVALVAGMAALTIATFGLFKQLVLPMRGFPFDPALAALDRALLGRDGWALTHDMLPALSATLVLDRMYSLWMLLMPTFPVLVAAAFPDRSIRLRLIGCWVAAWAVIGGVLAYIFGSAGPCFYTALVSMDPGFAALDARLAMQLQMANAAGLSIDALSFQPLLLDAFSSDSPAPAGGISAMPSMHVAMATLFAIAGFQASRWIGWIATLYAIAIWIGSVHLGWHYASDGPVAALTMWLIWRGSGAIFPSSHP